MSESKTPPNADTRLATLTEQHFTITKSEVEGILSNLEQKPGIDYNLLLLENLVAVQNAVDKDSQPALKVCTRASIINALVNAVSRGLSPALNQVYPIVRGNQLTMMPSAFGDLALVHARTGFTSYARVVREEDKFTTTLKLGKEYIVTHESDPRGDSPPCGAYLGLVGPDGKDLGIHYMTLDRIRKSWGMSAPYRGAMSRYEASVKAGKEDKSLLPPHETFIEDFMLRTVTRAGLKWILRTQGGTAAQALADIADIVDANDVLDAEWVEDANSQELDTSSLDEAQNPSE